MKQLYQQLPEKQQHLACRCLLAGKIMHSTNPQNTVIKTCLLYRHKCFTGKYTTRNIHKNYIQDPSGLCTYQCKSREGGVRARGGDLMPETTPLSGFWSCEATPGSGHLTLTDRSLVSIQRQLPNPSLKAFWKSRCWRKVWSFHLF